MNYTLEDLGFIQSIIGLRVQIHPHSEFWSNCDRLNPVETSGIVTRFGYHQAWIGVRWDTGCKNSYKLNDLMLDPSFQVTPGYLEHLSMVYGLDIEKAKSIYGV